MNARTREYLKTHPEFDKIIDALVELAHEVEEKRKFGRTGLLFHHRGGMLTTKPVEEVRKWQRND